MPPHRAGSVLAFLDGAKPAFQRDTAANLCRFGFRAGILVDESVILEINAMPALPACTRHAVADLAAHERPSRRLLLDFDALRPKGGRRRFVI
jgi:hypothetical protein